ncbi:hypothetical protein [Nocardioides sp.]|uniref:hypothetical protein n=1 Tax=Nocardioides sp. TaxID=35761 RepID=UPI003784B320
MAPKQLGLALLGVSVVCAALLNACSSSDEPTNKPNPSVSPGKPLPTVEADGLPADFPRDEIPIVDGEVTSVQKGKSDDPGYAVAVLVDGEPTATLAEAVSLLEGAGWKAQSDGGGVAVLSKESGQVVVTTSLSSDQTVVSYAIDLSAV